MKKQILIALLAIISLKGLGQVPSYVDTTALSGWWSFTGNAIDSSLHSNNGTVHGASLTTDRFGNTNHAYSFDGLTNYIEVFDTNSLDLTNNFTISAWVKIIDDSPHHCIVSKPKAPGSTGYALRAADGGTFGHPATENYTFAANDGMGINNVLFSNDTLDTATWANLIITYDGNTESLYKDDTLVARDTIVYSLSNSAENLLFGKEFNTGTLDRWFKGSIDDIGIWKRVLSTCELSKLYLAANTLIVNQPVNDTVLTGGIATYTITDTGGIATYQWQENSGSGFVNLSAVAPYSGVNTKTLTVNPVTIAMNSYHYRCVRNATGSCVDTSISALLIVNSTTGITALSQEQISISPNPAKNVITISALLNIESVEITNLVGQKLITKKSSKNSINIDIQNLTPGMYLLRVNDICIRRFVKE